MMAQGSEIQSYENLLELCEKTEKKIL
jgi:hypothetical protein